MGLWIFMLVIDLLIPAAFLGFGYMFRKSPPDKINLAFGYRSRRSMMNEETWAFAQRRMGELWFLLGKITLPLTVIPMLAVFGRGSGTVGTVAMVIEGIQMVLLIGSIFPVEAALKKQFDDNGRPRA